MKKSQIIQFTLFTIMKFSLIVTFHILQGEGICKQLASDSSSTGQNTDDTISSRSNKD